MNHDAYPDSYIREILTSVKTIAMVGASPVNVRPSYFAFKYLVERDYDIIPINPGQVGKNLIERSSGPDLLTPANFLFGNPQVKEFWPATGRWLKVSKGVPRLITQFKRSR